MKVGDKHPQKLVDNSMFNAIGFSFRSRSVALHPIQPAAQNYAEMRGNLKEVLIRCLAKEE
jgi:hypothetical protein